MGGTLPVCIVGAGPAGLVAANLLGQLGVPTVLLERNPTTSELPRGLVLDDEGQRINQALGLEEAVRGVLRFGLYAQYFAATARTFREGMAPFAEIHPPPSPHGFEPLVCFSQPTLERIWLGGLTRFPHVQVHFSSVFEAFTQQEDFVTAHWRDAAGRSQALRCAFLLGCDGGRSAVRTSAGIALKGSSFAEPWLVVDVRGERRERRSFRFFCDPPRPSMDAPGPGDAYRYEFMLLPGEKPEDMLRHEVVADLVAYDRALSPADVVRKAVYTFHARTAERMRLGRVFLLGDAAHLMPPFAGQGLNSCLRDAANLCWKLAAVREGRLEDSILDSYEVERRPNVEGMSRASRVLGRVAMARGQAWKLARRALFGFIHAVPRLRRDFRAFKLKAPARHTAGLYAGRRHCGQVRTGWLLPQPQVLQPDGTRRRLDAVLGEGFTLLVGRGGGVRGPQPALRHALWGRLCVKRVDVTCGAPPPLAAELPVTVGDVEGALGLPPGMAALVRPDRFVAGVFPVEEADAFAERLSRALPAPALPAQGVPLPAAA